MQKEFQDPVSHFVLSFLVLPYTPHIETQNNLTHIQREREREGGGGGVGRGCVEEGECEGAEARLTPK